jgi:hypothetical protein
MFYLRYLCIVVSNTYYVMCFVSFVFVFCLVYPILQVSLNFPFLVFPSVFSNVYIRLISSLLHYFILILLLPRFVYNRNFVCGIISDVMALSAEWRHLFLDVILTTMWRYLSFLFNLKDVLFICAIYVSNFKLFNLIITYLRNLFLKKINVNFFPKGHICLWRSLPTRDIICP